MALVFRIIKHAVFLLLMIGLLILNVLTVTVSGVNSLISGLVASALGVATVTSVLHNKLAAQQNETKRLSNKVAAQREAAKRMGTRLVNRSRRMAVRTMASIPAKSIPIIGTTIIVAGTVWELKELCEGLRDVEDLYAELEMDEPIDDNALQTVCLGKSPADEH